MFVYECVRVYVRTAFLRAATANICSISPLPCLAPFCLIFQYISHSCCFCCCCCLRCTISVDSNETNESKIKLDMTHPLRFWLLLLLLLPRMCVTKQTNKIRTHHTHTHKRSLTYEKKHMPAKARYSWIRAKWEMRMKMPIIARFTQLEIQ